ncbi:2-phosphosulfolactate phosphatase [Methanococcus aeolicus Nankai-3]|uniref:2-phosphosulfolactate phosphatase n=1 Tax=Methanococcus aeolicus (strain ATCC BAA-1280 / DSM 17508 / OCM 812 / Nankai-3) TaxID=419665 RepID=A6UVQ8_META3|nr:2-phosphosulfolactate phosphatase [Methanococcus aeolicus]ABR56580.1 2-phosphosulfolactate phosphatase [Methanococcus aeolicus Nankai-3]
MHINISYDFLSPTDNSAYYNYNDYCVIVIDVLRASTTINVLLELHEKIHITEVENIDNEMYKDKFIKFGEKNGKKIESCDYGNSPLEVRLNKDNILNQLNNNDNTNNKEILLATTNGTRVLKSIISDNIFIGSITNAKYVADYVFNVANEQNKNIIIIPSHRKGMFAIEDYIGAGLIAKYILKNANKYDITIDIENLIPAINLVKSDWKTKIINSASAKNLKNLGYEGDIIFCSSENTQKIVGMYKDGKIVNIKKIK